MYSDEIHEAFERGRKLDAAEAEAIEVLLEKNQNDVLLRLVLLSHLTKSYFDPSKADAVRDRRAKHIFWLMEQHPEHGALKEPECIIMDGIDDHYEAFRERWKQQVERHPGNPDILANAAHSLLVDDSELAEAYLLAGECITPTDPDWALFLSVIYEIRLKNCTDKSARKHWKTLMTECKRRCDRLRQERNAKESTRVRKEFEQSLSDMRQERGVESSGTTLREALAYQVFETTDGRILVRCDAPSFVGLFDNGKWSFGAECLKKVDASSLVVVTDEASAAKFWQEARIASAVAFFRQQLGTTDV